MNTILRSLKVFLIIWFSIKAVVGVVALTGVAAWFVLLLMYGFGGDSPGICLNWLSDHLVTMLQLCPLVLFGVLAWLFARRDWTSFQRRGVNRRITLAERVLGKAS
jgi:hypothetical protein